MQAYIIPELLADINYGYQVILYTPEAKHSNRGIDRNLNMYSVEDSRHPEHKIVNLVDGDVREGYLNFYFLRFSNDSCFLFAFGLIHNEKISRQCFAGNFQGYATNELTKKLNSSVENYSAEFKQLYTDRNVTRVISLTDKIIHSIR